MITYILFCIHLKQPCTKAQFQLKCGRFHVNDLRFDNYKNSFYLVKIVATIISILLLFQHLETVGVHLKTHRLS